MGDQGRFHGGTAKLQKRFGAWRRRCLYLNALNGTSFPTTWAAMTRVLPRSIQGRCPKQKSCRKESDVVGLMPTRGEGSWPISNRTHMGRSLLLGRLAFADNGLDCFADDGDAGLRGKPQPQLGVMSLRKATEPVEAADVAPFLARNSSCSASGTRTSQNFPSLRPFGRMDILWRRSSNTGFLNSGAGSSVHTTFHSRIAKLKHSRHI
ncbi:hypothetical protein VTI74DRAFT_6507 [Chaetomium olivicolor]